MRWFIFSCLMAAGPLHAKQFPVLSGEHEGFTRLTIHVPSGTEYEIEDGQSATAVTVGEVSDGFDLSDVFRRIGRDRISDVKFNGNILDVEYSCSCSPRVFQVTPTLIVVDIVDQAPPPPEPELPEKTQPTKTALTEIPQFPQLEAGLSSEIQLAADQGLLQLRQPIEGPQLPTGSSLQSHIGVRSHLTLEPAGPADLVVSDRTPEPCLASNFFVPEEWTGTFVQALANARGRWAEEPSSTDETAQEAIVRLYLSAGFGVEARRMLDGMGQSRDRIVLAEIGAILDDLGVKTPVLDAQITCSGTPQLFAFLGFDPAKEVFAQDVDGIVRTYLALPQQLRDRLDGRMSSKLLALDHTNGAALVLGDAPPQQPTAQEHIVRRDLEERITGSQPDDEKVAYDELAKSPKDVAMLMADAVKDGRAPDPLLVNLAATMVYENRRSDDGARLASLLVQARVTGGDLETAWQELEEFDFAVEERRLLETRFFRMLEEKGDADLFLTASFSRSPYPFPSGVRVKVADRLERLGFSDQARLWHPDAEAAPVTVETAPVVAEVDIPLSDEDVTLSRSRELLAETTALQQQLSRLLAEK